MKYICLKFLRLGIKAISDVFFFFFHEKVKVLFLKINFLISFFQGCNCLNHCEGSSTKKQLQQGLLHSKDVDMAKQVRC